MYHRSVKATLSLHAIYPEPPDDDLVAAFRKHVAQTGQPETFPTVSTSRPPEEGTVAVLFHPVDINRKTRPDKDEAPCSICSPGAPKWLHKGSLIWCEKSQAIYAIGPDCYKGMWADGRMDRAINLFTESQKAKEDGIRLYHLILRIPRFLSWVVANRALAGQVTDLHAGFAKDLPRLRAMLSRSLKATNGMAYDRGPLADIPLGVVAGRSFLSGHWKVGAEIDAAAASLRAFPVIEGPDLLAWIDALTPSARAEKCKEIEKAREALARAEERMKIARDFLSAGNAQTLGRWGRGEGSPIEFTVTTTGSRITFCSGETAWQGPVNLATSVGTVEPVRGWSMQDVA